MKRPSPKLVSEWYAKLRATGFRDIEYGKDLNDIDGWTLPGNGGGDGRHGVEFVQWPRGGPGDGGNSKRAFGSEQRRLEVDFPDDIEHRAFDHPTVTYYRGLEHAAQALKGSKRKLVIAASNAGAAAAARGQDMSRRTASYQVRKFAIEAGLLREAHGS